MEAAVAAAGAVLATPAHPALAMQASNAAAPMQVRVSESTGERAGNGVSWLGLLSIPW
jgi:hypothetical protein